jgi:AraC-like DNA-binding protein
MTIFNLPQDIFPDNKNPESIIIHYYAAPDGSFRGKSILHTNAISLVIEGEKTMHFAETTVHIKDDTFHFLSAGNCIASMKLSERKIFRSILIFFDNKVLDDFFVKYDGLITRLKGKHTPAGEPYISLQKDAFIYNYIQSLQLMIGQGTKIPMEMKQLKFEELMLHILTRHPKALLSFRSIKNNDFDDLEIRKAVEVNFAGNITIEELAFLCNTSMSTFKRRFLKIYGTSPNKWIMQRRMEMAKDLLLHHREKPGDIYHKVGYETHSSFTQAFKQIFGVTPKELQLQQLNVFEQSLNG